MTLLDAYAVIGFLADEPLADDVDSPIRRGGCRMTIPSIAEAIDRVARLYDVDPDEVAVDIASLGLAAPAPLDAATSVSAGGLRARHYHRATRALSMAGCALAATARVTGEPLATSDPHLLGLCHDEGILAVPLYRMSAARTSNLISHAIEDDRMVTLSRPDIEQAATG